MDMSTFHRQPGASVRRVSMTAVAWLGLTLLGFGAVARADDVKVQPATGSGFVVTDNTGASQRFKVLESGPVFFGGLVGSPPTEKQALCYDTTTGQVGPCPAAQNLAFCVPNAAASPRFVPDDVMTPHTITDMTTCLMWEVKTGTITMPVNCATTTCSDPHDVNNTYVWSASLSAPDGVLFTDFLPRVNGQLCALSTCPGLGGHSDWRVPTLSELQTIVDLTQGFCGGGSGACISSAFGPTVPNKYWSSATHAGGSSAAWFVNFFDGGSNSDDKTVLHYVRAVRGGL